MPVSLNIASQNELIPFPVGVSLGNHTLAVTRLCHDNMGYVRNCIHKIPDFEK